MSPSKLLFMLLSCLIYEDGVTHGQLGINTTAPTNGPTTEPTLEPTVGPTIEPTTPSLSPTLAPTGPTKDPTIEPTSPSSAPSLTPSLEPTSEPTTIPTLEPTVPPSNVPSKAPSITPTAPSLDPTTEPTTGPTLEPTASPLTSSPTSSPSITPTLPSVSPTTPTSIPTLFPTSNPTVEPTLSGTKPPSLDPTAVPTMEPTIPTIDPTSNPTTEPTVPTTPPTLTPTLEPTAQPTNSPVIDPTMVPTAFPSPSPTTAYPTAAIPITQNCTLSLNSSFNALWSFAGNNKSSLFEVAMEIIEFALELTAFDQLSAVMITIFDVRNGSIIIDYALESESNGLLDLALDNINDTISSGDSLVISDSSNSSNLTLHFASASNVVITRAPTATPTASPSTVPTTIPTALSTTSSPSAGPTHSPLSTPDPSKNITNLCIHSLSDSMAGYTGTYSQTAEGVAEWFFKTDIAVLYWTDFDSSGFSEIYWGWVLHGDNHDIAYCPYSDDFDNYDDDSSVRLDPDQCPQWMVTVESTGNLTNDGTFDVDYFACNMTSDVVDSEVELICIEYDQVWSEENGDENNGYSTWSGVYSLDSVVTVNGHRVWLYNLGDSVFAIFYDDVGDSWVLTRDLQIEDIENMEDGAAIDDGDVVIRCTDELGMKDNPTLCGNGWSLEGVVMREVEEKEDCDAYIVTTTTPIVSTETTVDTESAKANPFDFAVEEFVAIGAALLIFALCVLGFVMYQRKKQRRRSKAEQSVGLTPYAPSGMSYDSYKQSQRQQESKRTVSLRTLQKPRTMAVPSGSTAEEMMADSMGSINSRNALINAYDEDMTRRADTPEKSQSKSDVNPFLHRGGSGFNMDPIEIEDGDPGTPLKTMMSVYDE